MRMAELVGAVVLGLFSVYLMYKSGAPAYPGDPWFQNIWFTAGEGMGSGFWPFWLAGVMLLSTVWVFINGVRRASPPSQSDEPFIDGWGVKMLIYVIGGVVGFVFLSEIISMYFAMALFLLYYLKFLGRHSWGVTLAVALLMPIGLFFFFDVAMTITLPKGLLVIERIFYEPLYDIFL